MSVFIIAAFRQKAFSCYVEIFNRSHCNFETYCGAVKRKEDKTTFFKVGSCQETNFTVFIIIVLLKTDCYKVRQLNSTI